MPLYEKPEITHFKCASKNLAGAGRSSGELGAGRKFFFSPGEREKKTVGGAPLSTLVRSEVRSEVRSKVRSRVRSKVKVRSKVRVTSKVRINIDPET